jgi:hypothetical protein
VLATGALATGVLATGALTAWTVWVAVCTTPLTAEVTTGAGAGTAGLTLGAALATAAGAV